MENTIMDKTSIAELRRILGAGATVTSTEPGTLRATVSGRDASSAAWSLITAVASSDGGCIPGHFISGMDISTSGGIMTADIAISRA